MYSLTRLFFDNSRQVNARDGQAFRVKTYLVLAAVMLKQQLFELVVYPAFVGYGGGGGFDGGKKKDPPV